MLTPPNLMSLGLHGTRLFDSGFQQLWRLEARDLQNLGVQFHYDTEVLEISRHPKVTTISTRGNVSTIEAEHVFFTGNLAYLPKLLREITPKEKDLYGRVVNNDYRSYILRIKGLANKGQSGSFGFLPNTITAPFNHAVLALKPYADSDVHVFYAYGAPHATDEDILAGIRSDLALLHAEVTEVIMSQKWDYFPHVTSDMAGFFRGITDLQGFGGLWIAGEATSFTATIEVYKQGRDFASLLVNGRLM